MNIKISDILFLYSDFQIPPIMNILNLLTKEKSVAGIEISDSVIRITFLRPRKKSKQSNLTQDLPHQEIVLIEEPIAANIIEQGVVVDRPLLGRTLKGIWAKAKLGTNYAIVTIPDDKVYSRIFSFPKTVDGSRLSDAMRLAVGFQLPVKTEESYLDWERVQNPNPGLNEILLCTIPRVVAQGYVEALDLAGIKTLALESHTTSIARAIKLEPGKISLFTKKTPDGITIFSIKDGVLRFLRTLPFKFIPENKISEEVSKIKLALESELKETSSISDPIDFLNAFIKDDYRTYPEFNADGNQAKWLAALGALIRGQLREGEDNLISLLSVGTEEAYAYQKAATFITLIRNMTIGISIFFTVVFFAAYLFMFSLAGNAESTLTSLPVSTIPPELLEKETWIQNINTLSETGTAILSETAVWSKIIENVQKQVIEGVLVSSFIAPGINEKMSLVGVARDRTTLNQLKKSFQDSEIFGEIELPITNLEQRADIPFSLSFKIKDPSLVYYTQ